MMDNTAEDIKKLELVSTIGFSGGVPGGLIVHPDQQHLVYSVGNTIVVENIVSKKQRFLVGHTDNISCVTLSKSGQFIASGQVTHMGFKADIIVWDYGKCAKYCLLTLHKVKVEALAFSPNDKYLVSLGGQDDNSVVIWNLEKKQAICGSPAAVPSSGTSYVIAFSNHSDELFVTGGNKTLRVWELDLANRKIRPTDCNMGQIKRIIRCIKVAEDDLSFYCGTTSGDILEINMKTRLFRHHGPQKEKFSLGIEALQLLKTGDVLIGSGDGTVALLKKKSYERIKSTKVDGGVTSLTLRGAGHQFYVGTQISQIYRFNLSEFSCELINTCHYEKVFDVVFPHAYSDVFVTSSKNDIRVWNTKTSKELLRITVSNMDCNAVVVSVDGKSIISGWSDNKIRAYSPQTGKLIYTINDAHNKGVTAIATTSDGEHIISGGGEGQVRVWIVSPLIQKMEEAMKEHKGSVTCIKVRKNDQECVTASTDGSCIIWDLQRFVRNQVIFANTLFKAICYRPDECQIITAGTDRKIAYWETFDGSQIRELEGSKSGSIEGLDISSDGIYLVTGGADKLIKVWKYEEGSVTHIGEGHSGDITRLRICPNRQWIVSVGTDGAILRWRYPF
ncbi:cilia- and flagella-associated protein 52-like [Xenia sp. Carnegie-2017]|uniref:cilia- and flagella-associated protein 52-like n=1 Tax=Xenia sp. Carnegie-2017 TaxID=2897299 RepID=UPI001F042132|nr:cilia- and flagella-associated protein 52-like [Xenia sp. Carnegie-2017]